MGFINIEQNRIIKNLLGGFPCGVPAADAGRFQLWDNFEVMRN